jgi:FemAB-related protein (PEP-CTERM system-associated)
VRVVQWTDRNDWDAFVETAADGTIAHLWAWGEVVRETYGHRTEYLAAVDGTRVRGVLPLVVVRSRLFGRHVVSMPYLDYGGACSGRDQEVDAALVDAAVALADDEGAVLQLRHRGPRQVDLPVSLEKVTMLLDLEPDEDSMWRRLPSKRRGQIRKGQRHGLTASVEGSEGIPDFYRVLSHNMRDLGSPLHPVRFFDSIVRNLGDRAGVLVVRRGGAAVGAGLVIVHGDTVGVPWSSSLRSHFSLGPNQVLYWEAMRFGITQGARVFDFGRSSVGSGTYVAKREWGALPLELHWHHAPADRPAPEKDTRRMAWATRVWRRLPVRIANVVGPRIRGGIVN